MLAQAAHSTGEKAAELHALVAELGLDESPAGADLGPVIDDEVSVANLIDSLKSLPAQLAAVQQSTALESRVDALQTSLTELLERLDVMNDRIARMEALTLCLMLVTNAASLISRSFHQPKAAENWAVM